MSGKNSLKWKIGWGITSLCNMDCSFCYSRKTRNEYSDDLVLTELISFVDKNQEYIDSINYGTGENSLSQNWFDLLHYIQASYPMIKQAITTNGYLYTALKKRVDGFKTIEALEEIDVSLDFYEKERHNKFRKNDNAWQGVINLLEYLKYTKVKTTIVILGINETLTEENLSGIIKIAQKFNCYVRINIYRPVNYIQYLRLDYQILKNAISWLINNLSVVSLCDPLFSALILNKAFIDPSGRCSLRILNDGFITPSTYLISKEWKKKHIRDVNLSDENLFFGSFISNKSKNSLCVECSKWSKCGGGALDRRYLSFNDFNYPDPYCPLFNNDGFDYWEQLINIVSFSDSGPKIHDGYLPTLIFNSNQ